MRASHCVLTATAIRAREVALDFAADELVACFRDKDRQTYEQFLQVTDGKTTGALRASLGLVTTFADIFS
jgi:hypothetical protein